MKNKEKKEKKKRNGMPNETEQDLRRKKVLKPQLRQTSKEEEGRRPSGATKAASSPANPFGLGGVASPQDASSVALAGAPGVAAKPG